MSTRSLPRSNGSCAPASRPTGSPRSIATIPRRSPRRGGRSNPTSCGCDLAAAGYVTPTWPTEYGGLGCRRRVGARDRTSARSLQGPALQQPGRRRSRRSGDHEVGHRRAEGALPAPDRSPRGDLVPAVLRAGCRLRPRGPGDACGARRRHVVGPRPEGVDESRRPCGVRPAARPHRSRRPEAPRDHRVHHADEAAGRDGATAPSDHGRRRVLRGVLRRRAGRRLAAPRPGRRRLARRHLGAHERAAVGIREWRRAPGNRDRAFGRRAHPAGTRRSPIRCSGSASRRRTSRTGS